MSLGVSFPRSSILNRCPHDEWQFSFENPSKFWRSLRNIFLDTMSRHSRHVIEGLDEAECFLFLQSCVFYEDLRGQDVGNEEGGPIESTPRWNVGWWFLPYCRDSSLFKSAFDSYESKYPPQAISSHLLFWSFLASSNLHKLPASEGTAWVFAVRGRKGNHRRRQLIV